MLKIESLTRRYPHVTALDGLNMEIGHGQLYGFVGPNGAGKTTTIRIISGLLRPTSGKVWIDGIRAEKETRVLKSKIGYVPDFFGVYDNLTVMEYLEFYSAAYGIEEKEGRLRASEVLERVQLFHIEDRMVDELSRGMQQRLCLARAMIHRPQLLVMDEPASGLDPGARRIFKEVLRSLCEEGYTVLISSHILSDLADMCSNIGVIHQGKMVLEGPIDEIMTSIDSSNPILIEIYQNLETAIHLLNRHPLVSRIAIDKNIISILFTGSREEEAQLLRQLVEQKVLVTSFRREHNMKCAWIILGVNLVLALFALIAQMGLSGRENYMTILQYRFPIQCYVLMGYGLFLAICILIPGLAGGSIAGERERKTLDLLLTTHLSPWKIILGKLESSLCLIFLISFSTLPVIGLVLIYGGITLVNLFQLILNLVITGIFIGSIGIFYSAIMRKTTVAVILSYVTVVLLVLGTVGILVGIGYIQQVQGMYRDDFTGIRLGGLIYLLYFNPAVTLYGMIGQQTTNAYGLVRLCGYFGNYSHSFGVEHMVELSILVQLGCSALLLIAAGRHINPMRK